MVFALPWLAPGQDIILDPIEVTPEQPSARSLASGNWGFGAYDLERLSSEIQRRATRPVVVYIFDTAGKYTHPGLQAVAWNEKGRTFTGEPAPDDGNGHSTHMAGTYAGTGGAGPIGICDALRLAGKIRLIPIKVLSNGGSGSFSAVTTALQSVYKEVADLIKSGTFVVYNFSLGGGTPVASTEAELAKARKAGAFIVAAAGNSGQPGVIYPASGEASHAIAAVNNALGRAYFSTTGPEVEYAAPGQGIYSTYPPDVYRELSGTSMATPHAGAVAAIIGSVYPGATAEDVSAHIAKYSKDLGTPGRDNEFGYGLADIAAMLANAPGGGTPDPGPDPDPDPDPGPDPNPDYPTRTMTGKPERTYSVPWNTMDRPGDRNTLTFRICVDYTNKKAGDKAAQELLDITNEHFRARGYTLMPGADSWEAAYWVAYFYRLILAGDGYDVKPLCVTIQGQGIEMNRTDLDFSRKSVKRLRKVATKSNVISYTF